LEAEGPVVSFPNAQALLHNLQQSQGALCKIMGIYLILELFFNGKIHGPSPQRCGPEARSGRGGPRRRGGATLACGARGTTGPRSSPAAAGDKESDEAKPLRGSLEHGRQRRMTVVASRQVSARAWEEA
jgi:hypothetical protein